jgi:hypothetical protein
LHRCFSHYSHNTHNVAPHGPDIQASERDYAIKPVSSVTLPFYAQSIDKYLTPEVQDLLLMYSNVPLSQHSAHVHAMRGRAWAIRKYPCTGLGVWLLPYIRHSPAYYCNLQRLEAGATMVDIGCFLGGDLRRLCYDGAPSERMWGVDIVDPWRLGMEMYCDGGAFRGNFIKADVLRSEESGELEVLKGEVDLISISAVMHQWFYDMQLRCAERLVGLSKMGSLVFGHQIGTVEAGELEFGPQKVLLWRHNPASFARMWDEVGETTGTTWRTRATLLAFEEIGWDSEDQKRLEQGARVLDFVVERTS